MDKEPNKGVWKDRPMTYEVLMVTVTNKLGGAKPWAWPFIGDDRQAVKVSVLGHKPFYLDNEDGSALNAVKYEGDSVIFRSLGEPIELKEVLKVDWNSKLKKSVTKEIDKASADYWAKK